MHGFTRRTLISATTALLLGVSLPSATIPSDDQTIVHVLNRLGYGARPGDIERVRAMGVAKYIDQQLHPERIDDAALTARLEPLTTLKMSTAQIVRDYYQPALMERRQTKKAAESSGDTETAPARRQSEAMLKQRTVMVELSEQKLLRAVYGERQLETVLTDFWFNHFNVFAGKGADRFMLTAYERDAIRPNVLGNFRTLLGATAHSPAMLFYLDNWMSTGPDAFAGRAGPMAKKRPTGLNENYARELMELHTLSVDGGYSQDDVVAVARAFTGWTIDRPAMGGGYRFNPRAHDRGEKRVLGHTIRAGGGEQDGEQVLDILARHPSTATFIATKLARRFVSDQPPQALIDRVAKRFVETDGDLREVVRAIVEAPEFLSTDAKRAKVKTPLEFVVSALRVSSAEIVNGMGLIRALQQLGMPLYQAQPPTGYADTAEAWVNTGGLVNRMNFGVSLVENRVPGVRPGSATRSLTAAELGAPAFQRK